MYVIGKNDYEFIRITYWPQEVRTLEYAAPLNKATIISNYEDAKKLLKEIQNNINNIDVINHRIIGNIVDKNNSFNKVAYSRDLRIFELVPMLSEE